MRRTHGLAEIPSEDRNGSSGAIVTQLHFFQLHFCQLGSVNMSRKAITLYPLTPVRPRNRPAAVSRAADTRCNSFDLLLLAQSM